MRKITGWIIVVLGIVWAVAVIFQGVKTYANIGGLLGAVTVPILVSLIGLYIAGIIKKVK